LVQRSHQQPVRSRLFVRYVAQTCDAIKQDLATDLKVNYLPQHKASIMVNRTYCIVLLVHTVDIAYNWRNIH